MTSSDSQMPDLPKLPMRWKWIGATVVTTVVMFALLVFVYYPQLPDPMPIHWNTQGVADGFQEKSLGGFLGLIAIGPGVLILSMLGVMWLLSEQSGTVTGPGGAKTPEQAQRTWYSYGVMQKHLGWYLFTLNLLILILLTRSYGGQSSPLELPIFLFLIIGMTVVLVVLLTREVDSKYPRSAEERAKWWGIFYNDPEDARIMVDTGSGTNFTFNIGRPGGRILAVVLFGIPAVLLLWVLVQGIVAALG